MKASEVIKWVFIGIVVLALLSVASLVFNVAFGIVGVIFKILGSLLSFLFSRDAILLLGTILIVYLLYQRSQAKNAYR